MKAITERAIERAKAVVNEYYDKEADKCWHKRDRKGYDSVREIQHAVCAVIDGIDELLNQ